MTEEETKLYMRWLVGVALLLMGLGLLSAMTGCAPPHAISVSSGASAPCVIMRVPGNYVRLSEEAAGKAVFVDEESGQEIVIHGSYELRERAVTPEAER